MVSLRKPAFGRFTTTTRHHTDDPKIIEEVKEKTNLRRKWVAEVATESEADVKADRAEMDQLDNEAMQHIITNLAHEKEKNQREP